jgi:hypothetical protein
MRAKISRIRPVPLTSPQPRAPYALEPTTFPFPALAAMAGRAALGGPREVALACLVVARLVLDSESAVLALTPEQKRARALGAKHWLGSAAIPNPVRAALIRLAETSAGEDREALRTAHESVMTVTANQLDSGARLELGRLAQTVAA